MKGNLLILVYQDKQYLNHDQMLQVSKAPK
jgi:hypothetical protein